MSTDKKYIDLFAGCGGLSLGLHNSGIKGLFAIEKNSDAFKTLHHNLIKNKNHFDWPNWLPVSNHDINDVLLNYEDKLKALRGTVSIIAGGPPCQGFSMAGRRQEGDIRNQLVESYIKFVELVQPDVIFFENVKGFTMEFKKNKEKGIAYSSVVTQKLKDLGYLVKGKLVDFSEYGVPQKRVRFILIGIRDDYNEATQERVDSFFERLENNVYSFLEEKGLSEKISLSEAISDLYKSNGTVPSPDTPSFDAGLYGKVESAYQKLMRKNIRKKVADSHRYAKHLQSTIDRFKIILDLSSNRRNFDLSKEIKDQYKLKKHTIIPLCASGQSPTITTLPDDYIHYLEPRILTVREYARIQSFPDWYEFQGKYTTGGKLRIKEVPRYTQIGNAIPPLFAEQAGLILKEFITKRDVK
ncbi:DNA cytosine methyltransferase [Myroides odoratimimus]|uniref:DNA cytosine methyltransferase n=1 Tax=Myroides odoratimimus TaxID=76832 RepID=UPI0003530D29|nr:DNA cytosine methyltransferase [Myroides odoratimimus]EPH06892.1 DNA (cytosine-5-)-methyltransferase [Myroides odoratimimus CCUG 12700]MEC4053234.1 DNA cytosine methyltransferase [Myroides odoratimimus]